MSSLKTLRQLQGKTAPQSFEREHTALIIIDIQNEYFNGGALPLPESESTAANAQRLLAWARQNALTVVHIRHLSSNAFSPIFAPNSKTSEIATIVSPLATETVLTKHFPNAFLGTDLHAFLTNHNIETLIVCGMMTHTCVASTSQAAAELGYSVILAKNACTTRSLPVGAGQAMDYKTIHAATLAALSDAIAEIMGTDEIIALPVAYKAALNV
jgi:nicotinamidase-related amidase